MENQIYISQLSASLFQKLLFKVKNIDVRLNKTLKLKFILMCFDSAYPTHPSDTVTKCTIYPPILLVERLFEWSYFAILSYGYQNLAQKCFCFFIFLRQNICSSSFLQILLFYRVLLTPRVKQLLFGGSCSKNAKNVKTHVFPCGALFSYVFDEMSLSQ